MNPIRYQLIHSIASSMVRNVVITPLRGQGNGQAYQATVHVATNTGPEAGHALSLSCRGETPLLATWDLYEALLMWCQEPLTDPYMAKVDRADAPQHDSAPVESAKAKRGGR